MTLEEGIVHAEDVARMNHEAAKHLTDEHPTQAEKCEECAREHEQLVIWLKELKAYKDQSGDAISRQSLKSKLEKHHDFFVNAYGGFSNLPQNDKARVDEITSCIAVVVCEPSVTPQLCEDAISRQAAISAIEALQRPIMREESNYYQFKFSGMSEALEAVENLPSVTPQQRAGRWIKQNYGWNWQCSECGFVTPPSAKEIFTFCPNCGAKMEVKE